MPEQPGAVVVVPLDTDGRILIVCPHLVGGSQVELTARPLRDIGEDPLAAARQLLAEEAGLRADTWNTLLDLPVLAEGMDVASRIYLARDLRPVQRGRPARREISNATTQRRQAWIDLDDVVGDLFACAIKNPVAAASIIAAAQARDTAWAALRPSGSAHLPHAPGRRFR